jgi:hypothetical protein
VDPHDIILLTVALVASVQTIVSLAYVVTHRSTVKRYLRLVCSLAAAAVALSTWLHLTGVLAHGNQYFPLAVLATMVVAILYTVADW